MNKADTYFIESLFAQALQLQSVQRMDEAEKLYRQVIALDPAHYHSYCNLGVLLRNRGNAEKRLVVICRRLSFSLMRRVYTIT